jgi:hypothetical protein
MLATVTNTSGRTINKLDSYLGYAGGLGVSSAVGGNRTDPLPYPFGHIGELAAAGTKQLPMHPRDFRYKAVPSMPREAGEDWQVMIQAGVVTLAFAAETGRRDSEELFVNAV